MSIFSKILIFICLLMATGFVYVATIDWAVRYNWSYAVFREDVALKGLPLDNKEEDHFGNFPVVEQFSDYTLQKMFEGRGAPVHTQLEEVKNLQAKVLAELNEVTDEPAKRKKWQQMMLPLATSPGERYEIVERANDPKVSATELEKDINDLFEYVLKPVVDDQGKIMPSVEKKDRPVLVRTLPEDKHRQVAHLLFSVHAKADDESVANDHARLVIVIGLNSFNEEATNQAQVLQEMAELIRLAMIGDRAAFEVDYRAGIDELRDRAEAIGDRTFDLGKQTRLKEAHTELAKQRKADVERVHTEFTKTRKETFDALQIQAKEEDTLFKAQRIVGDAKAENERLERELRRLEKVKR
jgi:hypothetical protein